MRAIGSFRKVEMVSRLGVSTNVIFEDNKHPDIDYIKRKHSRSRYKYRHGILDRNIDPCPSSYPPLYTPYILPSSYNSHRLRDRRHRGKENTTKHKFKDLCAERSRSTYLSGVNNQWGISVVVGFG